MDTVHCFKQIVVACLHIVPELLENIAGLNVSCLSNRARLGVGSGVANTGVRDDTDSTAGEFITVITFAAIADTLSFNACNDSSCTDNWVHSRDSSCCSQ